ncbi:MAG: hypothetical protein ACI9UA_003743, partial [Pseudoalteromonas tetraodonis]
MPLLASLERMANRRLDRKKELPQLVVARNHRRDGFP